jgi:UDP-N-acetylmuramate dehydrogenase
MSPMPLHIQQNMDMRHLNTLRLPSIAAQYCRVDCEETLIHAVAHAREQGLRLQVLGGGSNTLLPARLDGLTIHMDIAGIELSGSQLRVGAGIPWHAVVQHALQQGLFGLENLALIPGSTGAAPVQNIGAYGREIADVFVGLEALDLRTGSMTRFSREQCAFGYRDSIFKQQPARYVITRVTLGLEAGFQPLLVYQGVIDEVREPVTADGVFDAICRIRSRKLPQEPNVGSFFKNPVVDQDTVSALAARFPELSIMPQQGGMKMKLSAAQLIEDSGLKGDRVGGAMVSPQHSLVIVNTGNATMENVVQLAEQIQRKVYENCGVLLETEPQQLTSISL